MKILAAAGDKRAQARPELPTIAEAGVPGFSTTVWFALFGPANMPPELVDKIHADVSKVLDLPQIEGVLREEQLRAGDGLRPPNSPSWSSVIPGTGKL